MGRGRDKRKRVGKRRRAAIALRAEAPGDLPTSEPEAFVLAPLKPRPGLRSGAIAIPEPEDNEEEITIKSFRL